MCTLEWAVKGGRALTLRLYHLGWGTEVYGKESNYSSLGLGGAFLRPRQELRGLRKENGTEIEAEPGCELKRDEEGETARQTGQREKECMG